MRKFTTIIFFAFFSVNALAQGPNLPIIDMHLHSYNDETYFKAPDQYGHMSPETAQEHFDKTYSTMRKNNIVLGAISGFMRTDEEWWIEQDKDDRLIRGTSFSPRRPLWTPEEFEAEVKEGKVQIFGEIGPYYSGMSIADPVYAPYLAICEKYDIPVAVHTGSGPPGTPYRSEKYARIEYGNPLLLEDVLVRHPKLRIYMMHAGIAYFEEALEVMLVHPQVYADLGVVLWVHESPKYYGEQFLRLAKRFGFLDRVLFGTDQMVWPHAIEKSLEQLNSFDFLSHAEKRDILYNNAARFLRLSDEVIAKHYGE